MFSWRLIYIILRKIFIFATGHKENRVFYQKEYSDDFVIMNIKIYLQLLMEKKNPYTWFTILINTLKYLCMYVCM